MSAMSFYSMSVHRISQPAASILYHRALASTFAELYFFFVLLHYWSIVHHFKIAGCFLKTYSRLLAKLLFEGWKQRKFSKTSLPGDVAIDCVMRCRSSIRLSSIVTHFWAFRCHVLLTAGDAARLANQAFIPTGAARLRRAVLPPHRGGLSATNPAICGPVRMPDDDSGPRAVPALSRAIKIRILCN